MTIKPTTVRNWLQYLDQGDKGKMANGNEWLRQKISRAFNEREADLETIKVINAFVNKKKAELQKIENNANE